MFIEGKKLNYIVFIFVKLYIMNLYIFKDICFIKL